MIAHYSHIRLAAKRKALEGASIVALREVRECLESLGGMLAKAEHVGEGGGRIQHTIRFGDGKHDE
jgi:hypothetical protein